ncbi:MAG TPA: hypothetical protein VH186_04485 [Chloroflexia bacterium]|nr:hypothetical protein [Chloroflexia bacterium]
MAVTAVRVSRIARQARPIRGAEIKCVANGEIIKATKICPAEFDEYHRQVLMKARFASTYELIFDEPGWRSVWIGAGEEKVVFLAIDPQGKAMALELLAKGTYLDGHLVDGDYYAEIFAPGLANKRWDTRSLFGHIFSGRVKVREFIYGDTLAGPGLHTTCLNQPNFAVRLIGCLSRKWARFNVYPLFKKVQRVYRDAHEANVMIELLPLDNPELKSHHLFPVPWLEEDGHLRLRYYRLTPIDVRVR